MAEFPNTPSPTIDSAPRGLYHPDNFDPIYAAAHASIDQNAVINALVAEIGEDERHQLATPPLSPEMAARTEVINNRLTNRLAQIALDLTEQEITATIEQLTEEARQSPLTTQLGEVQFGFHQAQQDRLNAPDGEPELPVGNPGTAIGIVEATDLMQKQNSPSGLTSDDERRRLAELFLSPQIDGPVGPIPNPHYLIDPMSRLRVQQSLQSHATGVAPARSLGPPGSRREGTQRRVQGFGRRWSRAGAIREEWGADRSATLSKGPEASSNGYGTQEGLLARDGKQGLDARSQERLTRNEFARKGAVFRYFDVHTGTERNFIVEGAHARQATWQPPTRTAAPGSPPPPTPARQPLYFMCDDGSRGEPVVLDEFGNIMNQPVGRPGSNPSHRSTSGPTPATQRPVRMCNALGQPVHVTDAQNKLAAGSIGVNPGESTGAFRPGAEIVMYRPLFTEEEVEVAHRYGINGDPAGRGLAPNFHGDPEDVVGPRYTTIDDLVFASASDSYTGPNGENMRPRPIQQRSDRTSSPGSSRSHGGTARDRRSIIRDEYVWQSETEMNAIELADPNRFPPEIIQGEHDSDRGRFVHTLLEDSGLRGSTRTDDAWDGGIRMPTEAIRGADRAEVTREQRQDLETRDRRTRQRIPYRP